MPISDDIYKEVADKLGFSKGFVKTVYKGYWKAVRKHISELPLKNKISDEEFLTLRPNVNIPSIGKLYVTLDRFQRDKKANEIVQNIMKCCTSIKSNPSSPQ